MPWVIVYVEIPDNLCIVESGYGGSTEGVCPNCWVFASETGNPVEMMKNSLEH